MESKVCHTVTSLRQEQADFVQIYSENVFFGVLMLRLDFAVKAEIVFREKDYDYGFRDRSTRVGLNTIFSQTRSIDQKSGSF